MLEQPGTQQSTLVNSSGTLTTYTNPWKFNPDGTPKWVFKDNVNSYALKVIRDEWEGASQ